MSQLKQKLHNDSYFINSYLVHHNTLHIEFNTCKRVKHFKIYIFSKSAKIWNIS